MEYLRCQDCGERVHPSGMHRSGHATCPGPTLTPCTAEAHQWRRLTLTEAGMDVVECAACGTWAAPTP